MPHMRIVRADPRFMTQAARLGLRRLLARHRSMAGLLHDGKTAVRLQGGGARGARQPKCVSRSSGIAQSGLT